MKKLFAVLFFLLVLSNAFNSCNQNKKTETSPINDVPNKKTEISQTDDIPVANNTITETDGNYNQTQIVIEGYRWDNVDPLFLSEYKNLEAIRIYDHAIESLSVFSECKKLKQLVITDTGTGTSANMKYNFSDLAGLQELEMIIFDLEYGTVEIDFLGIENLKKLNTLMIGNYSNHYTLKNTDSISKATGLTRLELYLTNGNINFLITLTKLNELKLYNGGNYYFNFYNEENIKKDGYITVDFQAMRGLSSLEELRIYGFTIHNVETINELPNLKEADIIDSYITPNNDYNVISPKIELRYRLHDLH